MVPWASKKRGAVWDNFAYLSLIAINSSTELNMAAATKHAENQLWPFKFITHSQGPVFLESGSAFCLFGVRVGSGIGGDGGVGVGGELVGVGG